MPKKPPKNGFFYFMLSYKKRAESNGKTFPGGMPEVATAASPEWKSLPQFRKDYFNDLAKEKRNDPRPNIPKRDERRFNSQGKSFAEIKMEKVRAEERRNQERDFISNFVHEMNLSDLRDKFIYLIHVNIFCKTDKDVYFPAEIGLVKFSLREGVKDILHRYIDPGNISPGYSFEVKDHSERTHKLTPQFVRSVDGTSDFARLYKEICKFLTEDEVKSEDTLPPLFTMYDNIFLNSSLDAVKGMFKSLWNHIHPSDNLDDNNWESVFRVFPLPDMFFHLKNRCMAVTNPQTIAFPNDVLARAELQKDTYHFELDSACKFHRDEDIIAHCSQSFVLRWAYIIRDHCADLIGVDLFPKYIAPKTEIKEERDEYFDTDSMTDSQYSKCWSGSSRAASDWGTKSESDSCSWFDRKIKQERDYYPECKKERDRHRFSPENCVKLERDRCSAERQVKRERDRYSSERRVKRERDRSCTPDRHVKRERDRGYSPDRQVKRERDRGYSPDRHVKRERDRGYSPDRHERRERDRGYSPDNRIKRERDRGYSPDRRIKSERDRGYSPDRRIRREDRGYSPDSRIKSERDRGYSPSRRIKRDYSRSPERDSRRERGRYSAERVPKRERDYYSPERAIKRERDSHSRAKEVHLVEPENGYDDVLYDGTFTRKNFDGVANGSMKQEQNMELCSSDPIKLEKEPPLYSEFTSVKPKTEVILSTEQQKDADFIKQEKSTVKSETNSIQVKEPGSAVEEENLIKPEEVEIVADRPKAEVIDLTYADW